MNLHALAIPTFTQMLRALSGQLDKAAAFAGQQPSALIEARLAPDMFPLSEQVRFACRQAAETILRLTGQPLHERAEVDPTFEALKARIAETLALLEATSEADFEGAAERAIELDLPNGIVFDMTGEQFLRDWGLPQFYFHLTIAYAVMRQAGVPLGKADLVPHALAYLRPGTMPGA
ncbi:DUF1993 domain-containing protein [Caulobacter sp. NIBR2454]|uniref:DUF1993 domain-containing protein n=1 Tax=Caulobacter sp. NIBR2454 TaxID=3015996 RepID=UPI0022B70AC0|nr:DUF1993 domain-containing protein [Caulobacter sp. NIBR2454]